ncbi:MAG: DNA-directed RNA polymerase subunit B [Candidatus Altiarchaeota archaeon]|nr:DNA-directed RNA polymerase subunit B [Candidatus Altiarchaeota archaeon]
MINIMLNGRIISQVTPEEGAAIAQKLRERRRKGKLDSQVTIAFIPARDELRIDSSAGRLLRPLIVIEKGKVLLQDADLVALKEGKLTWSKLIKQGKVEYLDGEEEEDALIALTEKDITSEHTHMEIHPIILLGVPGSLIPFANYSRGDRVNYGTSKGVKQGLGIYSLNYPLRFDTFTNILYAPQNPLVKTKMHDVLGFSHHPAGQNFVVAMLPWEGYNMEDAVIMNKGSLQRAIARSTYFRPYTVPENRYPGGQEDRIGVPEKDVSGYSAEEDYQNLDEDGMVFPESWMDGGDVLVGKTSPPRFLGSMSTFRMGVESRRDTSSRVRHDEHGRVDSVVVTENVEGRKLIRVRMREDRRTETGDKFSSRHGQKGVVGLILPPEDMPFTEGGVIPDMITNPHGIPSRMTFNQLIDFLAGKAAAVSGDFVDGTPFEGDPIVKTKKLLTARGFKSSGNEVMYNGISGEKMEVEIFSGVIYYHKVRHMVANKIHVRARGPVQMLTRQPTEGRSKLGGLRMGEMEKDCLVSHGASLLLDERFSSDRTRVPVCTNCGIVAVYNYVKDKAFCPLCSGEAVEWVEMSYAFHIMLQELITMGIYPKMVLKDKGW